MKVIDGLSKLGRGVAKNSPIIFTIGGVLGLGATAVLSYKAAKKVEVIMDDVEERQAKEQDLNDIKEAMHNDDMTEEEWKDLKAQKDDLEADFEPVTRAEIIKDVAGAVALPVVTGIASIAFISLSYYIQNNRIVNLAGALATASAERIYYKKKYTKEHGEEAAKEFYTPSNFESKEKVVNPNGEKEEVDVHTKADKVDRTTGAWFDGSDEYVSDDHNYNLAYVSSIKEKLELRLFRKGALSLNEVFDAFGFERTRAGGIVGWTTSDDFTIDFQTTYVRDADGSTSPQIYISWEAPGYIYDSVVFDDITGGL